MTKIPPGKGGSPGQPYDAPKEDPKNPYVPAPKKLVKKNKNKQGDPEGEYSKPLKGAPAGQNLTPAQIWREGDTSYS